MALRGTRLLPSAILLEATPAAEYGHGVSDHAKSRSAITRIRVG